MGVSSWQRQVIALVNVAGVHNGDALERTKRRAKEDRITVEMRHIMLVCALKGQCIICVSVCVGYGVRDGGDGGGVAGG